MKHLILGSQSPRRREILSFFRLPFEQIPSGFDEEAIPFEGNPEKYAQTLSKGKCEELFHRHPQSTILTADTIVYHKGIVYGKPRTRDEAIAIISMLQGEVHNVYTSLSLRQGYQTFDAMEETHVHFNPLTKKEVEIYVDRNQWADKAAGYNIQSGGGLIVRKVDGCYYNVMGLPVNALRMIFMRIGVDLWEYI